MKQQTLTKIRKSIAKGYLPENWHEEKQNLVETETGYYALNSDCIDVGGDYYHEDNDRHEFDYDEIQEEYILSYYSVTAYGRRGREYVTHRDRCVSVGTCYYHEDYLSDNDIVWVSDQDEYYHRDDVYFWDSDDEYHLEPEDDEDDSSNLLWGYNEGEREKNFVEIDKIEGEEVMFGFGMEIEKSEMPDFDFDKWDIYNETGAVLERDGSVDDGFELKTPVYNLFSPKTEERLSKLKSFADIKGVENAGGHIGFSMIGKSDEELIDLCSGFIPLIFAMYKKRLSNDYCSGKKIDILKSSGEKMQAIRMRGSYIEFRIFSSVKNYNTILFRLNLFRIMAKNLGKSFPSVIGMAVNKNSELHKLLTNDVYSDTYKFERLIKDAIEINSQFGIKKLTQSKINQITTKLNLLKCA
jgi:hypothetical protein